MCWIMAHDYNTEDPQDILPHIQTVLNKNKLEEINFSQLFEMRIGYVQTTKDYSDVFFRWILLWSPLTAFRSRRIGMFF